jgi:hypothetical protein
MDRLTPLSKNVHESILWFLDALELVKLRRTCSRFRHLTGNNKWWALQALVMTKDTAPVLHQVTLFNAMTSYVVWSNEVIRLQPRQCSTCHRLFSLSQTRDKETIRRKLGLGNQLCQLCFASAVCTCYLVQEIDDPSLRVEVENHTCYYRVDELKAKFNFRL